MSRTAYSTAVAALVSAALVASSGCDPVTAKRTTEQFIPVKAGTRVEVSTVNGWIKVVQGRPGIVAIKTHRRASALVEGAKGLKQMTVVVEKKQGVLRVTGTHPADPKQRRYQLNFVVEVPPGTPVTLRTQRGSLRLLGVKCDADGRTDDGEIKARNVQGRLRLATAKGNINVVGRIPRFDLQTKVGDIQVSLRPETKLAADSTALTHHGNVTLRLGPKTAATVTAKADAGTVRSAYAAQDKRPGWLRSVVAGGGPGVLLHSKRGRVTIKKSRKGRRR